MSENLLTLTMKSKLPPTRQSSKPMPVQAMQLLPMSAVWVKEYAVPAAA